MDEHQRRIWARMAESVDGYRAGGMDLRKLVQNLQGLMGAAGLHDQALIDEFWNHEAPIDMELDLRTEDWAPPGSGSDEALDRALADFRRWVMDVYGRHVTEFDAMSAAEAATGPPRWQLGVRRCRRHLTTRGPTSPSS